MPPPPDILADRLSRARRAAVDDRHGALLVTSTVNLRYLFGVAASAGMAVLHARGAELVVDARYAEAFAEAIQPLPDVRLHPVARGASYESTVAAVVLETKVDAVGVEAESMTLERARLLGDGLASVVRVIETHGLVAGLRVVKDDWELAVLRQAGQRLSAVAACILPQVSEGLTERQVAWQVEVALHDAGFDGPAFEPIVASGPNAARPHHRSADRRLQSGDVVIVDFGGRLDGYAVDMTRTVTVGAADPETQRCLQAVGQAARAAAAAVAPGVLPSTVDQAARDALSAAGLGEFFVHSTGHGLGLEVHERPWIAPRGDADGPLLPGMVFTIEPGVYVPGFGGVRLEDDVVVTATGLERLTDAPAPYNHHER